MTDTITSYVVHADGAIRAGNTVIPHRVRHDQQSGMRTLDVHGLVYDVTNVWNHPAFGEIAFDLIHSVDAPRNGLSVRYREGKPALVRA